MRAAASEYQSSRCWKTYPGPAMTQSVDLRQSSLEACHAVIVRVWCVVPSQILFCPNDLAGDGPRESAV